MSRLFLCKGLDAESDEAISMITDATARLTTAVSSLPELLEKKKLIDMHTNIATAVLEQIKTRKLDAFFEAEEKIMNRTAQDAPLEMLRNAEMGNKDDKLRLLLIHYICGQVPDVFFLSASPCSSFYAGIV